MSFNYRQILKTLPLAFKFLVAFILLVASDANCAQLTLQWDESLSPGVEGYIVYYGTNSKNYTESFDIGKSTSCVISKLVEGQTYFFAVTSYYDNDSHYLEGPPSEEFSYEVPFNTVSSADSDGDGILDDEELSVYGTDPQKADTDGDGLNDGAELAFWANDWDSDYDGDGLINLLDPDSDNDGFSDGIEFDKEYDPMDPNSRPESVKIWLEAENGDLISPVEVAWDENTSSGGYIFVPNGWGNVLDANQDAGYAAYAFQVSEPGDYMIWGRVLAVGAGDDSFFISVDDGGYALWNTQQAHTWVWDQVNNHIGLDPFVYFLDAGEHTLVIKQKEDGTKIDRILITNDPNYIPEGLGENYTFKEDLEAYDDGDDLTAWMGTGELNSMLEDNSLFKVFDIAGNKVLGTTSTQTNIHTHYIGPSGSTLSAYEYTGRMMMTSSSGGIGVTFLSQYPNTDVYYRLRRYGNNPFHIDPHGTSVFGVTDTGVVPSANFWYHFRIWVKDTGIRTEIKAKVWRDGGTEPVNWQVDAYDDTGNRMVSGTFGVWSYLSGSKYWDDLMVIPIILNKCKGDFDEDGDVDGNELFKLTKDEKRIELKRFAEEFGRFDCD